MSSFSGPKIDINNLVLYLDAGNSDSYVSGSTTWYDLSGNNYNGTLINGTGFSSEKNGCMTFDGIDDMVRTNFQTITVNSSFEIWANRTESVNAYNMMAGMYLPYFAMNSGNTLHFSNSIGGVQRSAFSSPSGTLMDNTWYCFHFVNSYDGVNTTMKSYINGTLVRSITNTGQTITTTFLPLVIGGWRSNLPTDYPFKGKISIVKVYNKELTQDEINQNYNATKGRYL
jgi:hypothetical protein